MPVIHRVKHPDFGPGTARRLVALPLLVVLLLALAGMASPVCAQTTDPVGVAALVEIDQLPRLRTHTRVHQVSSYDPTGGNDDGFHSVNFLYLDRPRGEFVLLEESGAGCIYRIQIADLQSLTSLPVRLRVYLDGAAKPQIDLPLADLFSGKFAPFVAPLVGASHQVAAGTFGYFAYVPIPFSSGVRVTMTGLVHFYNITYHTYRPGIGQVPTWGRDRPIHDAASQWRLAGSRPTPSQPNAHPECIPVEVHPRQAGTVLDVVGGGVIDALEFDLAYGPHGGQADLDNVHLEIYWDNETTPSVNAPLSLFFLAGPNQRPARSLLLGGEPDDRLYCYFPMPFWTRARIRIVNNSDRPFSALALVDHVADDPFLYPVNSTGYFRCRVRSEPRTRPGHDFTALSVGGRGHVVGIVQEMRGVDQPPHETNLEGDERIYIDFERTPSVHGNGTEDFFNGAYYFLNQTFSAPVHGSPFFEADRAGPHRIAYRLFLGDTLPFRSHIRMSLEVGGVGHLRADYRAAVFYYHRPEPALVHADRLDLGNSVDEQNHGFVGTSTRLIPLTAAYEGDLDDEFILDGGVNLAPLQLCRFWLTIPATNDGLVFRRRLDYLNGGKDDQDVLVDVDNNRVGTWSLRGSYLNHLAVFPNLPALRGQGSADKRWRDSDFLVPAGITRGRTRVLVTLTNVGRTDWNGFEIQALARVTQPVTDTTPPGPPTNLTAHGQAHDDVVLTWDPAPDNVGVERYEVERSLTPAGKPSKLGETYGTRLVDHHASLGSASWYYRVRGIDAAGNIGAWGSWALGTPGKIVHYECEELLPGVVSPGTRATQLDLILFTPLGRLWSGDNQIHYAGTQPGQSIQFTFQIPVTAAYALSVSYSTFFGACSFDVRVDHQTLGSAANDFAIKRKTVVFPKRTLTAGAHTIEFRLAYSPGPYTGNQIVVDCFRLTP